MVFSEFLEAIARCAMAKWEDEKMAFNVKLEIALDTVINLKHMLRSGNKEDAISAARKPKPPALIVREIGRSILTKRMLRRRRNSFNIGNAVVDVVTHSGDK